MIPSSGNRTVPLRKAPGLTTDPFESPLRKPVPLPPQIAFDQCSSVFAVDVSGSTHGVVLEQEIIAIKTISGNLPSTTKSLCSLIPWNHRVYQRLHLDQVDVLVAEGGTQPDELLADDQSRELLQKSHLWFLFTDGAISPGPVEAFAQAINEHKLHGKACVLVLFGYRPPIPTHCNISVGISAFGVVPDCIFLFHDVESHELFVLQTKGCFTPMKGAKERNLILDDYTEWKDLPLTSYESLFTIQVPRPLELKRNEIVLQNRQQIDLGKLCSGEIDSEDNDAILNDDENLKAVLLTLSSRGKSTEARNWLNREKANASDISRLPRTDVSGHTMQLVEELIQIMRNQPLYRDGGRVPNSGSFTVQSTIQARVDELQSKLRLAHARDWEALGSLVQASKEKTSERGMVLDHGLARLSMAAYEGLGTPKNLSPSRRGPWNINHLNSPSKDFPVRPSVPYIGNELPNLTTYIPGYCLEEPCSLATLRQCPLCNEAAVSYAILLKAYPSGAPTPGFPSQGNRSEIRFPLALSDFRETDVVSQFVCCDICAFHLISYGLSPFNEDVKTALPVLPSLNNQNNRKTWLDAVDGFFEERFERRNLMLIMLAILSGAYDKFTADAEMDNTILCAVLQDACTQLRAECRISYGPGLFGGMTKAMDFYFQKRTFDFRNELLQHPVESFTLLLRYTPGVQNIDLTLRTRALFLRLVLHVLEHSFQSRDTAGGRFGVDYLNQLKEWEGARHEHRDGSLRLTVNSRKSNRKDAVAIDTLKAHNLADGAVLDCFSSLGTMWEALQETCLVALHVCLSTLANEPLADMIALKVLERWDCRNHLHTVLVEPEKVDEDFLASLIKGG